MPTTDRLLNPECWVTDHGNSLFAYAVTRVRCRDAARDLVQETFMGALQSRHRYGGRASERTWLLGILKHKLWDLLHRQCREQISANTEERLEDLAFNDEGGWNSDWSHGPAKWTLDPELAVRQDDFKRIFTRCLEDLPPRQATAFTLRELQGLDTDAICRILDIKPNNLWVLLHRARLHLRASLATRWLQEPLPIEPWWRPEPLQDPAPSQAS